MKITRVWAMPSADTFNCLPIGQFVQKYLQGSECSIDPFARNFQGATYTNDLNPETMAEYHLDSADFMRLMERLKVSPDLAILDPPFSPEQMKRAYDNFGLKMGGRDALRTAGWKIEKNIIARILRPGGIVLCFGWNSCGMGKNRGFQILEIMLVCHGAGHNDTICMAERKFRSSLFDDKYL